MDQSARSYGSDPRLAEVERLSRTGRPATAYTLALAAYDEAAMRGDTATRADAASWLAFIGIMLSLAEEGIAYGRIAATLFREAGDRGAEARARAATAWLLSELGDPTAIDEAGRAASLADGSDDPRSIALAHGALGVVQFMLGHHDLSLHHQAVALDAARRVGDPIGEARVLVNVGLAHLALAEEMAGEARDAKLRIAADVTAASLAISAAGGDSWIARTALCNLVEVLVRRGLVAEALALLERSADTGGELGPGNHAHLEHTLSLCHVAKGDLEAAERALEQCIALCDASELIQLRVLATRDLATLQARQGRFEAAYGSHRAFHALHLRLSADGAQRRARALALQHQLETLIADVDRERRRAETLEASNHVLTEEARLLLRQSLEDGLTGLPNRRCLDGTLARLGGGATGYAIAMIDVDRFKLINDRLSHAIGDAVLRALARILADGVRTPDLVARYGGEEFVVVMTDTALADAVPVCERLAEAVRRYEWCLIDPALAVTVSAGVAGSDEAAIPPAVLALADRRLRRAKIKGRDRIEPRRPRPERPPPVPPPPVPPPIVVVRNVPV